jgi:prephenate dehydrogenase/3-phosphoshikimate 1-carboxyvinyltransferase
VIHGSPQLHGIEYTLPVASAQVKSALLLAGLAARGRTQLTEPAPSRDHSERMLRAFGAHLEQHGRTVVLEGGHSLRATALEVPADFSSAAFFLVAGVLAAERPLHLTHIGVNPTRTGLLELLQLMGADIRLHPRGGAADAEPVADIEVRRSALRGITVPERLVPLAIDELPVFFVAAACARGDSVVRGAAELRVKESDRLAAMAAGLGALGVGHELLEDGLRITGTASLSGGTIDSRGDHRIAMAFAVAALHARAPIVIDDVANVATSFPGFEDRARQAGLGLEIL